MKKGLLALCLVALQPCAAEAATYTSTILNPVSSYAKSNARSINRSGVVAGYSYNITPTWQATGAVWYTDGSKASIGGDTAAAINSSGQVAGSIVGAGYYKPFMWDPSTGIRNLAPSNSYTGHANGINNSGKVTGECYYNNGYNSAFVWSATNGFTVLGKLSYQMAEGNAINNTGQVAGSVSNGTNLACIWGANGTCTTIGTLGGESRAWGINDGGQVVGRSKDASGKMCPFIWDSAKGMQALPFLTDYDRDGEAWGINNLGYAVGWCSNSVGGLRATIWAPDGTVTDLGVPSGSSGCQAYGINDLGQVVGQVNSNLGIQWNPVPEPSGLLSLLLGLGSVFGYRKMRSR
ncbi:MAG: PEP-CTERM sorting domain-containing protein [Armatimonadetes bacterium]|nr:PEP-CTERM sorting domain-containing protein [Armatimonadota bacterium]